MPLIKISGHGVSIYYVISGRGGVLKSPPNIPKYYLHLQKILGFFVNANAIVEFEE